MRLPWILLSEDTRKKNPKRSDITKLKRRTHTTLTLVPFSCSHRNVTQTVIKCVWWTASTLPTPINFIRRCEFKIDTVSNAKIYAKKLRNDSFFFFFAFHQCPKENPNSKSRATKIDCYTVTDANRCSFVFIQWHRDLNAMTHMRLNVCLQWHNSYKRTCSGCRKDVASVNRAAHSNTIIHAHT